MVGKKAKRGREMGSEREAKARSYRSLTIMVKNYDFIISSIGSHRVILNDMINTIAKW